MTEGWICPTCERGVAPGQKYCDHGEEVVDAYTRPLIPTVTDCGCPIGVCRFTNCPRRQSPFISNQGYGAITPPDRETKTVSPYWAATGWRTGSVQ